MTDRFMNEEFQTSEGRGPVWLGRNYADGADTRQDSAIWINATGTTQGLGYAGFTLDVDEAERFRDHLTAVIDDVKSRKPKEPKNSEIIEGYSPGVVFTLIGDSPESKWLRIDTGVVWLTGYFNGQSEEFSFFDEDYWKPQITTL